MVFCKKRDSPHKKDGPWSWVICFASFFMNVILFGFLLSFGVLLPVLSNHFKRSKGTTAWIGSLAIGFAFLCGPVALRIIERFGERTAGVCSGFTSALSIFVGSFATDYWMLYISNGVCLGFFISCIINSVILIMRKYFQKKLALAIGLNSSGGSIGVLTVGPALQALVDTLGWRNALRVMAGALLLTGFMCIFFDPNVEEDKVTKDSNDKKSKEKESHAKMCCSVLRTPKYTIGTISIFIAFFGLYVPMLHMVSFAKDCQITGSKSSLLFIYIGILSTVSRLVTGTVMERRWLTPLQAVQLSCFLIGLSIIVFTQAKVYYHFIIFAIFYGFASGGFIVAQSVFYMTCFTDIRMASVGWTTAYVFSAVALFMGAPLAGFVADYFGSYIPTFFFFGGVLIFAGALPLSLCCFDSNRNKAPELGSEDSIEVNLKLIGSRLANVDSSLNINIV